MRAGGNRGGAAAIASIKSLRCDRTALFEIIVSRLKILGVPFSLNPIHHRRSFFSASPRGKRFAGSLRAASARELSKSTCEDVKSGASSAARQSHPARARFSVELSCFSSCSSFISKGCREVGDPSSGARGRLLYRLDVTSGMHQAARRLG